MHTLIEDCTFVLLSIRFNGEKLQIQTHIINNILAFYSSFIRESNPKDTKQVLLFGQFHSKNGFH